MVFFGSHKGYSTTCKIAKSLSRKRVVEKKSIPRRRPQAHLIHVCPRPPSGKGLETYPIPKKNGKWENHHLQKVTFNGILVLVPRRVLSDVWLEGIEILKNGKNDPALRISTFQHESLRERKCRKICLGVSFFKRKKGSGETMAQHRWCFLRANAGLEE